MTIVTYTLKPGQAEANAELIRAVFAQLEEAGLPVRYEVFRDGDRFLHIADGDTLTTLPAFRAFAAEHADRCLTPPEFLHPERIGAYAGELPSSTSIS